MSEPDPIVANTGAAGAVCRRPGDVGAVVDFVVARVMEEPGVALDLTDPWNG